MVHTDISDKRDIMARRDDKSVPSRLGQRRGCSCRSCCYLASTVAALAPQLLMLLVVAAVLLLLPPTADAALFEFGEFRAAAPASTDAFKKNQQRRRDSEGGAAAAADREQLLLRKVGNPAEELLKEDLEEELLQKEDSAWWELAFSMSMDSLPKTTKSPSSPPPGPSSTPTIEPQDGGNGTASPGTVEPSTRTEQPNNGTTVPTVVGLGEAVFGCSADGAGVYVEDPPYSNALTPITMRVGYLVESVAAFDEYQEELEWMILRTAVIGALQCNAGGAVLGGGGEGSSSNQDLNVPIETEPTGECQPQLPGTACTVFETEFRFVVDEELDPESAAFLGYVFLQEEMDDGAFTDAIPIIDRIKYLSPTPLLPPIVDGGNGLPTSPDSSEGEIALGVSPWTLAAVLSMCIGGLVALAVWVRNRRTRNERHMQLLESEDVSLNPLPPSEQPLPQAT